MKNLKIFPKMFIQIFSILGIIIILTNSLVFYIFPKTYLQTRKEEIYSEANKISANVEGRDIGYIYQSLDFYSKNSDIKAFVKEKNKKNEVEIKNKIGINKSSKTNSLIIEERQVRLNNGEKLELQFVSTADMHEDAKNICFKFLPYSLLASLVFSVIVSLVYAKSIKNNIEDINTVTDKMMKLDKDARLIVDSNDEIGHLKEQINDLYFTLLRAIDDLEFKNKEILKLEKIKYDFLKGASHELKTPLASLKIILENMKYNIGKYKDRDLYISDCIDIVDGLTQNVTQILSVSSLDNLKDDEKLIEIKTILDLVIGKYEVLANQKNIRINNYLLKETIYIGQTALKIILSNLISNAVKYTDKGGFINIGVEGGWLYIENLPTSSKYLDKDKVFDVKFDLNKKNSNGLGLYIVGNLLNNYNINHEVDQDGSNFIFKISLNNSKVI